MVFLSNKQEQFGLNTIASTWNIYICGILEIFFSISNIYHTVLYTCVCCTWKRSLLRKWFIWL